MNDNEIITLVAYVGISKIRKQILIYIGNDLKYPSQISKDLGFRIQHVSSALKQLKERNLVECVNEDVKVGRLYRSTENGKKVIQKLK